MTIPRIRGDGGHFMIALPEIDAVDGGTVYRPRGARAVYTYKTMRGATKEIRDHDAWRARMQPWQQEREATQGGIILAWDPQLLPIVTPDTIVTPNEIDRMSWEEFCERQTTLWGQLAERARSEPLSRSRAARRRTYLHLDQDAGE